MTEEVWAVMEGDPGDDRGPWLAGIFATEELADAYCLADLERRTPRKKTVVRELAEPMVVKRWEWHILVDSHERREWGPSSWYGDEPCDPEPEYETLFPGLDGTPRPVYVKLRLMPECRKGISLEVGGTDHALVDQAFLAEVERVRADFDAIHAGMVAQEEASWNVI